MGTYVIGDIQGCFEPLRRLLAKIAFDPVQDRLWLVGDLVNRGPDSLAVLRWAVGLEDRVTCVLGNHDVYLLARAAGVVAPGRRDSLAPVLVAPDRDALLAWLAARPVLTRQGDRVLVHAGLHPAWSLLLADTLAREVEAELRGHGRARFLAEVFAEPAPIWSPSLRGRRRARAALACFTRLRCVAPGGAVDETYVGPLDRVPAGLVPWWRAPRDQPLGATVYAGHWAAIGVCHAPGLVSLDSGCVWGRALTAVRLEDDAVFVAPCLDARSS